MPESTTKKNSQSFIVMTLAGLLSSGILIMLLFPTAQVQVKVNMTEPLSSSNTNRLIHLGHYLSIFKRSDRNKHSDAFEKLSSFLTTYLENHGTELNTEDSTMIFAVSSKIVQYGEYRAKMEKWIHDRLYWSKTLKGNNDIMNTLHEGSIAETIPKMVEKWNFVSVALSLSSRSRLFLSDDETQRVNRLESLIKGDDSIINTRNPKVDSNGHLKSGICKWEPSKPMPTSCDGDKKSIPEKASENAHQKLGSCRWEPSKPMPTSCDSSSAEDIPKSTPITGHQKRLSTKTLESLIAPNQIINSLSFQAYLNDQHYQSQSFLAHFLKSDQELLALKNIVDSHKIAENPDLLLKLFQSGDSESVAAALFLESAPEAHTMREALLTAAELTRLNNRLDAIDNLLLRSIELDMRRSNDAHAVSSVAVVMPRFTESEWLTAANDVWK